MTDEEKLEILNRVEAACWRDIGQYSDDYLLQEIMTENYLEHIERCQRIRIGVLFTKPMEENDSSGREWFGIGQD